MNFNLPLKLSLCLAIPSLAVAFFIIRKKKNSQEENTEDDQSSYENAIRSRQTIIEIKVPNDCVRSIIGSQGCVIKEIQRKTNTRINFKDNKNKNENGKIDENDPNIERTLVIRGSNINVQNAELEIKRMIVDMPMSLTEEYYVPEYACGRIIGKGGNTIREISKLSSCKVKLYDRNNSTMSHSFSNPSIDKAQSDFMSHCDSGTSSKLIKITGSTEQISYAKDLIMAKIKEEEAAMEKKLKKKTQNYSISNFKNLDKNNSRENSGNSLSEIINTKKPEPKLPDMLKLEDFIDDNKCVNVFVSAVADPLAFWVQLANDKKLDTLVEDMNSYFNTESLIEGFRSISDLKIGSLVAARFGKKTWHRAEIKSISNENLKELIDIYYVDFGDSAYLTLDELKKLPDRFFSLPYQAIECSLNNLELEKSLKNWPEESLYYFEDITYSCKWNVLNLKVIQYKQNENDNYKKPLVRLFDPLTNSDISDLLVQNGYASYVVIENNSKEPIEINNNQTNKDINENIESSENSQLY